ncbi:acylphosphatase [Salipaludibacillus aurantiacus]|uniref:acylphosphatase n=1 Tax=Salipaludibacillus aurantiacus TaxID=1601833 RepID=A0A1H9S5Q5_9BACI|nr:acylphosphatase [Salipaludibacillus aurantiacus]SER79489.1 acylphosphatase [Salipaludibacillus aurantiacus]
METKRLLVFGNTQGVGFRKYTRKVAYLYNIAGWVQNKPDGSVEIVAQGSSEMMELFIEKVKKGPKKAIVSKVNVLSVNCNKNYKAFKILRK